MMERKATCALCYWATLDKSQLQNSTQPKGFCVYDPPVARPGGAAHYPKVTYTTPACRRFEPKEKANDKPA